MSALEERRDPREGTVVASVYRLDRLLGRGGYGAVYAATHTELGHRVAIKLLRAELAAQPDVARRFKREARAASSIGHPNIVEVRDLLRTAEGEYFMVLELLEGRDLGEQLATDGPMVIGDAVDLFDRVCDGLAAVHRRGIVHRDLKPGNVFLCDSAARVKILDFGISKALGDATTSEPLTETGAVLGTPHYMSPEQIRGAREIDERADIYSLGVMIFEALVGQRPFDAPAYPPLFMKICVDPPPKLTRFREDAPVTLEALLRRMMAKDPADRPASCDEVREALRAFRDLREPPRLRPDAPILREAQLRLEGETGETEPRPDASSPEPSESERGPRRARLAWGGLALVTVAIAAGLVAALVAPAESPAAAPIEVATQDDTTQADTTQDDVARDDTTQEDATQDGATVDVAEPESSTLDVRVTGASAELWVDGARHGEMSPGRLTSLPLARGEHTVELRRGDRVLVTRRVEIGAAPLPPLELSAPADSTRGDPAARAAPRSRRRAPPPPEPREEPTAAPEPAREPAEDEPVEVFRPRVGVVRADEF